MKNGKPRLRFFCPFITGAIPAQYAVVKLVTLDADEPSVEEALEWELTQHLVGEPDDFVFDAQEMTGIVTGRTRTFLLAAYRRTLVEQTADMVRSANFKPLAIGLDIFGLINAFEANYRERSAAPCLLVHCEEAITKLILSRSGEFLDFHCFNNHNDAIDEKSFTATVASEIDRFCRAGRPEAIYVTGSWFQQILRRETFFETVKGAELLNPFREVKCQVVIDGQQLKDSSTQLAVAVGLALQPASAVAGAGLAVPHVFGPGGCRMISINLLKQLSGRFGKTRHRPDVFFKAIFIAAIGVAIIIAGVEIMHLWLAAPYRLPAITWHEVETEVTGAVDTVPEAEKPKNVTAIATSAKADFTRHETVKAKPPAEMMPIVPRTDTVTAKPSAGSAPAVVAAGLEKALPGAGEKAAYEVAFANRVFSTLAAVIPDDIEFTAISLDSFARLSIAGQS